MNKRFILLIICIALFIGALVLFFVIRSSVVSPIPSIPIQIPTDPTSSSEYPFTITPLPNPTNPPTPTTPPIGNTVVIQTQEGGVPVRNFYKDPKVELLSGGVGINAPDYTFYYNQQEGYFAIVLTNSQKTAQELRDIAEQDFLALLGVTKEDACKLNMILTVDSRVDPELGGDINYGLSFCLGGKTF